MKNIYLLGILALSICASCGKQSNLQLILLTKNVVCVKSDLFTENSNHIAFYKAYDTIGRNVINFKIVNNSNKNYFIVLNDSYVETLETNKVLKNAWKKKLTNNIFAFNLYKKDSILSGNTTLVSDSFDPHEPFRNYNDSVFLKQVQLKKLYGGRYPTLYYRDVKEHSFVLHPGESRNFTSLVNLPYRTEGLPWLTYINKQVPDSASISLVNVATHTEENLSEDQKRDIKENHYVLFDGEIESNKIPVKIIEMK
jgi:hypothetical protein